jgi:hypothetical protein
MGLDLRFEFQMNRMGLINGMEWQVEPSIDPVFFSREPATIKIDSTLMQMYTGTYELGGMESKVYTKADGILYLFVAGQPEYELLPTGEHKFTIRTLEGYYMEFVKSDEGNFDEVLFIQPNGTFKARRKHQADD